MISNRSSRTIRRTTSAVAAALTLSLLPLPSLGSVASAQAPATAITGLTRGARGDAVKQVQQALVNQGIAVEGGVDGVFGVGTEAAVKQFQKQTGISPSGSVDNATAIALGLEKSSELGLSQGVSSAAVKSLQQKLIAAGHAPRGGADGVFGPSTKAALEAFQKAKGLKVTGQVDAATAGALAGAQSGTKKPAATPSTGSTSMAGLKIGSRGDQVKRVQNTLMGVGFTVVGGADGIYGVLTANAVKSFQTANGLGVTGAVDKSTAALLEQVGGGKQPADPHDPTVSSPYVGLQYGSLGADVKSFQQALIAAGFALRGGADGVYGLVTQAAVKQFQSKHGLAQSGKVDEATAGAIASGSPGPSPTTSALVGLKAGALGNTVKQLQQSMINAGITVRGGADGIFGPATAEALRAFQTSQGLSASGTVDQATAAALANPKAPVSGPSPSTSGYAKYGEKGTRVSALQSALVKAGIALKGGVDGDFGGATSAAVMEFQRQKGLSVTGKVNEATAKALGVSASAAPTAPDPSSVTVKHFPVQARCYYGDSYGYNRGGGRTHLGVDVIATKGAELYAAVDGRISKVYTDYPGSLSGNGVRVAMPDGTYFFYAHMQEFADGIELGVPVKAGQVIGYVGSTGNAGTPHLHLEIHPQGGAAVNPYPLIKAIDAC